MFETQLKSFPKSINDTMPIVVKIVTEKSKAYKQAHVSTELTKYARNSFASE